MFLFSRFLFISFIAAGCVFAQADKIFQAVSTAGSTVKVDGKLLETAWEKVPFKNHFIQRNPHEGGQPSEATLFKIIYDSENLFVAFRCFDKRGRKVERRVTRRDQTENTDYVAVYLDSYFDRRTAFQFQVTPGGVKYDAIISEDGQQEDMSWDPVWQAAVSVDDSGWTAEMKIPFSQLRFPEQNKQKWGLQLFRNIHHKQEECFWTSVPKEAPGFVSLFGQLQGLENIASPDRMQLLPYSIVRLSTYPKDNDNPFSSGSDWDFSGGLDGKWKVSSNLTMDFTINPDFGQVEADPSEMNLTAFETFFDEKRPFFIEGKNIFNLKLALSGVDFAQERLFYSRRIGRTPQYDPDLEDDEYIDRPQFTSILGAAKLSGKTSSGWSLGVIEAHTAEESAEIGDLNNKRKVIVEPRTNYFVSRLQKDFNRGNTLFGTMLTATNRVLNREYLNFLPKEAYSGGVDFLHQWDDKSYFIEFKSAFSHVKGHPLALLDLQTNSARYFQRPDAHHVSVDSGRTAMTGHGGNFNFLKVGGGRWRFGFSSHWRSPELELNDVGYLREADQIIQFAWLGYRITDPFSIFRLAGLEFAQWNAWNFNGNKMITGGNLEYQFQFKNYWSLRGGFMHDLDALNPSALRGGPMLRTPAQSGLYMSLDSDSRKSWQIELRSRSTRSKDHSGRESALTLDVTLKPSARFNTVISPFYINAKTGLQYVETIERADANRYIFAELNQETFGLTLRFDYSLTPDFSIQFYGQPFISAGSYQRFKRITHAQARRYRDRFVEFEKTQLTTDRENEVIDFDENRDGISDYSLEAPDFNFRQFRSNLVVRWEYRPGSQVYFVWAQGRTGSEVFSDFSLSRNLADLFAVAPDNILLCKLNYWFSL